MLREVFEALRRPPMSSTAEAYSVAEVPGVSGVYVGLDRDARPALLVQCKRSDSGRPAPVVMRAVEVRHDVACLLALGDGAPDSRHLTLIRCVASDRALQSYFVDLLDGLVLLIPPMPARGDIASVVLRICELFASLEEPPARDTRALWAELFVIASAADPAEAVRWWRMDPAETYDFSFGRKRLEVKSFAREPRGHHFGLDQLRPPDGVDVVVISMCVRASAGGLSLRDLVARVRPASSPELAVKIDRVVAKSLGAATPSAMDERFDAEVAIASWRCFTSAEIPCVRTPVPVGVTDVRFRVAMDRLAGTPSQAARLRFPAFSDVLPP